MIDVKLGVPVGEPIVFYNLKIKNRKFNSSELREFVEKTKNEIDESCEKIDESISMASFYLNFLDLNNKKDLEFIISTTDLTVFNSVGEGISWIKGYYKWEFKHFLDKLENRNYCLDINVDFYGFRDKVTEIVSTFEPPGLNYI